MGIKKRYSWNSEKNEFEEREVSHRAESINQYYRGYLIPLIILIIVIAFGNMITSDWFIKKLIYLHTM